MRLTSEIKIIGGIALASLLILFGGVFLLSKQNNPHVPKEEIVAENSLHWHPKLAVYIKGEKQEIPADIGLGAVHQKIHTHKEDNKEGIIHMEMPGIVTKDDTKLGNFFRIWGKQFTSRCVIDFCTASESGRMAVNGEENQNFDNYLMKDKDLIEIRYE